MTIKDLANLQENVRGMISNHLDKTGKTINALSVEAGIHPTQLWLFIKGERGLTAGSLEKLGRAMSKK
jgi:hypothetical protein